MLRMRRSLSPFFLAGAIGLCLSACARPSAPLEESFDRQELMALALLEPKELPPALEQVSRSDPVSLAWASEEGRAQALEFFSAMTGSLDVATAILDSAARAGVSPALAFALAYEESRFVVGAVNKNADSLDRGLFQLNSKAFPELGSDKAFDPRTNAALGLSHLAYCICSGGNEIAGLAMYNAGPYRVSKGGTPRKTLDYIFRVLRYRDGIETVYRTRHGAQGSLALAALRAGID